MSPTPHRDGYGQKAMAIPTASANVSRANTPNDDVVRGSGGAGAAARPPDLAGTFACLRSRPKAMRQPRSGPHQRLVGQRRELLVDLGELFLPIAVGCHQVTLSLVRP